MARDNSPNDRQRNKFERKQKKRASHDRILIVSEGSKTEPLYFNDIRTNHRLYTAHVEVRRSELGTSPIQVVQYAHDLFLNGDSHKKIQARAFEQVYTVFDRDQHPSYRQALELAKSLDGKLKNDAKQSITFQAIASVPSFELWLLLHFEDIKAPLRQNEVMQRLKKHIPDYEKSTKNMYSNTRAHLDVATQRAEKLAEAFDATTDNTEPYTGIFKLVKKLITLND